MVVEEKIVYKVEAEGTAKVASDFQRVTDELSRLGQVLQQRPEAFAQEYAKSVNWLADAMSHATSEGKELGSEYAKVIGTLGKFQAESKRLAAKMEDVGVETKKAGGKFGFAWGKAVKFFGAIGLGVYSMYTFASAIRRGTRAIKDWVVGGIEKAIERNQELSMLIKTQVTGAFDQLQLKLGNQVTPGIREAAAAVGHLIQTLEETGAIDAFGRLLSNMLIGAARGLDALATGADKLKNVVDRIKESMPETGGPDWERITGGITAAIPGAAGALAPFGLGWVPGAAAGPFIAAGAVARAGEVSEEETFLGEGWGHQPAYQKKWAEQPKEKKPGAGQRRKPIGMGPQFDKDKDFAQQWVFEDPSKTAETAKKQRQELTKTQGEIQLKAYTEAMKKAARQREVTIAQGEMFAKGLVSAAMSGDVKAAMASLFQSAMSEIVGFATRGLLGTLFPPAAGFQHEGLVTQPQLAMVGEAGPEFIMSQERMQGLMRGGKPGYEFGPEDFNISAPDVNVAAPNVQVNVNPGVNAEVDVALQARAGEVALSELEA